MESAAIDGWLVWTLGEREMGKRKFGKKKKNRREASDPKHFRKVSVQQTTPQLFLAGSLLSINQALPFPPQACLLPVQFAEGLIGDGGSFLPCPASVWRKECILSLLQFLSPSKLQLLHRQSSLGGLERYTRPRPFLTRQVALYFPKEEGGKRERGSLRSVVGTKAIRMNYTQFQRGRHFSLFSEC